MPEIISCASGVRLRQLLPEAKIFGADDIVVQACTADSRTCRAGDLFAALVGSHVDGHDYVAASRPPGRGRDSCRAIRSRQLVCPCAWCPTAGWLSVKFARRWPAIPAGG